MTPQGAGSLGRRRCPICGSRKLVPSPGLEENGSHGKALGQPGIRWRCRSCESRMHEDGSAPTLLWRRRRPLDVWLFEGA